MTAPRLSQSAFTAALFDPSRDPAPWLRTAAPEQARRRFAVHRNTVAVTLVDALSEAFPVARALVGDDFFRAMAREYVHAQPPRSPVLAAYGDGFGDFIEGFGPAQVVPYLADVARLEALRTQAYHAADAEAVGADAFQALAAAPERLAAARLRLHPAARWLRSHHATGSLWDAHQYDGEARDAALAAIDPSAAEHVLVMRPQWDVVVSLLPPGGADWLDALHDGAALGEAMSRALQTPGAQPEPLWSLLIAHGLAVALDSQTES